MKFHETIVNLTDFGLNRYLLGKKGAWHCDGARFKDFGFLTLKGKVCELCCLTYTKGIFFHYWHVEETLQSVVQTESFPSLEEQHLFLCDIVTWFLWHCDACEFEFFSSIFLWICTCNFTKYQFIYKCNLEKLYWAFLLFSQCPLKFIVTMSQWNVTLWLFLTRWCRVQNFVSIHCQNMKLL